MEVLTNNNNLHTLKIVLKDNLNNNIYNKNLLEFLENNYKEIIDSNYYIQPILVDNNNINYLVKKNIKNTPSLLDEINNIIHTGANDIIKYIVNLCENGTDDLNDMNNDYERNKYNDKPSGTKKLNNINSNDNLQNYLLEQAYNKDNELEEPLDLNKIKDKADRYNKLRDKKINSTNSSNANKNLINNIKKNVNNKNSSVENYNDYQEEYTNLNTEITKTRPLSEYINDDSEFQNFLENLEETVIN
jgi:hypothetical protein